MGGDNGNSRYHGVMVYCMVLYSIEYCVYVVCVYYLLDLLFLLDFLVFVDFLEVIKVLDFRCLPPTGERYMSVDVYGRFTT